MKNQALGEWHAIRSVEIANGLSFQISGNLPAIEFGLLHFAVTFECH